MVIKKSFNYVLHNLSECKKYAITYIIELCNSMIILKFLINLLN